MTTAAPTVGLVLTRMRVAILPFRKRSLYRARAALGSSPSSPVASLMGRSGTLNLIDRVAQCRTPLAVFNPETGRVSVLNNAFDCAEAVARCRLRYVLIDNLTRLCADLAYSKGARSVACADLLHVPAEALWVEWNSGPWKSALQEYGIRLKHTAGAQSAGRRGAWIQSSPDGRRGLVRTFWCPTASDVLASSAEAYFDFDTPIDEAPESPDAEEGLAARVVDPERADDDILSRCFRFRYEESWSRYYEGGGLADLESSAVWQHALGTIAMDIPMLLTFFLLLATRGGLPQQARTFEHLNRRRLSRGKPPLLEHIEVRAPVLPDDPQIHPGEPQVTRRGPRLHHVRGHLARRGSHIFWRVPHLRGNTRFGVVQTRTVTLTF